MTRKRASKPALERRPVRVVLSTLINLNHRVTCAACAARVRQNLVGRPGRIGRWCRGIVAARDPSAQQLILSLIEPRAAGLA
jgi:hypothetical protein